MPASPDSFHSPSAQLDNWLPTPTWPPERTGDPSSASGAFSGGKTESRAFAGSLSHSLSSGHPSQPKEFVLAPLDFQTKPNTLNITPSSHYGSDERSKLGAELRRPSTAPGIPDTGRRPSDTRTHVKGGASLSHLSSTYSPPSSTLGASVSSSPRVPHTFGNEPLIACTVTSCLF